MGAARRLRSAEPGQLVAIVGPSGSGKTTLSYLVPRLYDAGRGRVLIDGQDVPRGHAGVGGRCDRHGHPGHVPPARERRRQPALREARRHAGGAGAGRAGGEHPRPDRLVRPGLRHAGGRARLPPLRWREQRLAIARVLLKDPRILILDEATSALDTTSERLVQEALEHATRRRTTIAIAHRLSTILGADLILAVEGGRIVERGTHAELLALDGLYARLYTEQFAGGKVEVRCKDGVRFRDGRTLPHAAVA